MSNELKNILLNSNKDIDNQKLMDYLSGKLSADEKLNLEKLFDEPELLNDAAQGLQQFENKYNLSIVVAELNADLHKHLKKKKNFKRKRRFKSEQWIYISIIIILTLIIIGFLVIRANLGN